MVTADLAHRLEELLEPVAKSHGYELVAIEQSGGRHTPVIRVLLDREGGIDLEALTIANRWVSETLDASDPVGGQYTLEVSSPGVDRPLHVPADFERFVGETVVVKTRSTTGRAAFTGTIVAVRDELLVLDVEGEECAIPLGDIVKARLKGRIDFGNTERSARNR